MSDINDINDEMKIVMADDRIITRKELFEKKEEFHKEQARLPFEEKIKILIRMKKIANSIRPSRKDSG